MSSRLCCSLWNGFVVGCLPLLEREREREREEGGREGGGRGGGREGGRRGGEGGGEGRGREGGKEGGGGRGGGGGTEMTVRTCIYIRHILLHGISHDVKVLSVVFNYE